MNDVIFLKHSTFKSNSPTYFDWCSVGTEYTDEGNPTEMSSIIQGVSNEVNILRAEA